MPVINLSTNQYELLCKHAEELGKPVDFLLHDLINMWKKSWVQGRREFQEDFERQKMDVLSFAINKIEGGFKGAKP